ncbi:MAG: homocysteine S-methyltransferase [Acidimicrobiales bacterium]
MEPSRRDDAEIVILDGGLSNALRDRGLVLGDDLWTARLLRDDPEAIIDVHCSYFLAGADVATTASYQASVDGFVRHGMDAAAAGALIARSVELACEARDRVADEVAAEPLGAGGARRLLVAASVGPYGAVLHDGSEYRGRYGLSSAELRDFHGPRLDLLAAAGPDLFAVETIPDADEAEALVPLLDDIGIPALFSYSVRDGHTCAGQRLADAYGVLAGSTSIVAAGANCSAPAEIEAALVAAAAATGRPGVAYPNRGGTWDATTGDWHEHGASMEELVPAWLAAGARWIGGCCEVGPDEIRTLARLLRA